MKLTVILILLLCVSAHAQPEKLKWEHLADSEQQQVFTDLSTMAGIDDGKQMWFKFVPLNRTRFITANKLPRNYDHQLVLLFFRCGHKTFTAKKSVWYSTTGGVLKSLESTKAVDITPDSLNAEIYHMLCAN